MSMVPELPPLLPERYEEILQDLLARARVHNPEWTHFGESDPGVTILQLFAYLTTRLAAEANQIPERNRRKFLSLLGVPLVPAVPAKGFVTFHNPRGPAQPAVLPPHLELRAGPIPFHSREGLEVLPVEARVYYKRPVPAESADLSHLPDGFPFMTYETAELAPPVPGTDLPVVDLYADTADQTLWIALLARPEDDLQTMRKVLARETLTLGVLPAADQGRVLPPRVRQFELAQREFMLPFEMATDRLDPQTQMPIYLRLQASLTANILREPGLVTLRLPDEIRTWQLPDDMVGRGDLPPLLVDPKTESRLLTWIRMRLPDESAPLGLTARLHWVGINADMVEQVVSVESEYLGRGNGEPDQSFNLIHKNVIPKSVRLWVGGSLWTETDDLMAASSDLLQPAHLFTLDPASGEIRFGNGLRGARPRKDERIQASYDYGGGRAGNVEIGAINKAPVLPPGLTVKNPVPTWGGLDAERTEEAERHLTSFLRHQDRLVTTEDFADILRRTPGVQIGRAEVLPLYHPTLPGVLSPGVVTILAMPASSSEEAPPVAEGPFLNLISEYLEPRRLVTTELVIRGPVFLPLQVSIGVEISPGRSFPAVREMIIRSIRRFLSPLHGGRDGKGWPLNHWVRSRELWTEVSRVDGVAYVRDVCLGDAEGSTMDELPVQGLELPWLRSIDVQQGDPLPLGPVTAPPPSDRRRFLLPFRPKANQGEGS